MAESFKERRGSRREASLSSMEKQYLLACERGDVASVREFLALHSSSDSVPDFNISCADPLGRTSLHIAIENENIEMIELLLEANVETGDCLLHAINEENVEAVEIILNHLEKQDKFNLETQGVVINEHSAFTPDIKPIILAAHRDNYEIIKLLLDRGATISHPHDVHCGCKECVKGNSQDSLRLSQSRYNTYRALASASLICLSARDPILYAFELSWEIRRISTIEHQYKLEYQQLSQKCQKFAVDLLDQTRSSEELATILNYDSSDRWPAQKNLGHRMGLSRLRLAIQFRQKRFVAHPNCQQLLASIWYEGLPGYRRKHIVFQVLLILTVLIGFPVLSMVYWIAPRSSIGQFMRKPFIKFLCHAGSYCTFIILLILASQRINYDLPEASSSTELSEEEKSEDIDRKERRGPPPSTIECAIILWIFGLIWVEIKQLWEMGVHDYMCNMWNILDFITNALYISTITLRIIAYLWVENELRNPDTSHLGRLLPRRYWNAWDPMLISECVFATANIFSSLKMVHLFTINPHLGPLQISLGRMLIDIIKFFFVYTLVIFAFACGLNQLFWYYALMRRSECDQSDEPWLDLEAREDYKASCHPRFSSFSDLFVTVETLFWSIFGLVDLEHFRLKEDHVVTEWTGKTMFGSYGVISIVVLLNMLIAMMSNSYQYISNQADVEWKFARSKLWIEYFEESGTVPPPFNIIPSPKTFITFFKWFTDRYCHNYSLKKKATFKRSVKLQKMLKSVSQAENNYQFVTRNLVKRYIAKTQHNKQKGEGVTEDDVNELKQDISAFRYELLSILSNSGFNTGQTVSTHRRILNKRRSALAERRLLKGFSVDIPCRRNPQRKSEGIIAQNDVDKEYEKCTPNSSDKKGSKLLKMPYCLAKRLQLTRQSTTPDDSSETESVSKRTPLLAQVTLSDETKSLSKMERTKRQLRRLHSVDTGFNLQTKPRLQYDYTEKKLFAAKVGEESGDTYL